MACGCKMQAIAAPMRPAPMMVMFILPSRVTAVDIHDLAGAEIGCRRE